MGKTVDLNGLADTLRGFRFAYLVTVGDDYRAHTTTVTPTYESGLLDIGPVGRHGRANLAHRRTVTLVWPAREVSDYSLIVDGHAELPDDPAASVQVKPTRARLHRPVFRDHSESATGTVHDCVDIAEA
ncbi:MAG TPA: hypothetical protein VFQ37_16945 [Mycobacterium sp.]|nr:hypothetical protein [Mycobacterium sp.]